MVLSGGSDIKKAVFSFSLFHSVEMIHIDLVVFGALRNAARWFVDVDQVPRQESRGPDRETQNIQSLVASRRDRG